MLERDDAASNPFLTRSLKIQTRSKSGKERFSNRPCAGRGAGRAARRRAGGGPCPTGTPIPWERLPAARGLAQTGGRLARLPTLPGTKVSGRNEGILPSTEREYDQP